MESMLTFVKLYLMLCPLLNDPFPEVGARCRANTNILLYILNQNIKSKKSARLEDSEPQIAKSLLAPWLVDWYWTTGPLFRVDESFCKFE